MRRQDKLIRKAFQIYQSSSTSTLDEYEVDYKEGFEEKIYQCIDKMHISNPRVKARRIWLGILAFILVLLCVGFVIYKQSHKAVDVTKTVETFYNHGYFDKTRYHINDPSGYVESGDLCVRYRIQYLKDADAEKLKNSGVTFQKTKKDLIQRTKTDALLCYESEALEKRWRVYQLSDRDSQYFYILKDDEGNMAIAKYHSVCGDMLRINSGTICKKVFGLTSEKAIRNVSLERVEEKDRNHPDKRLAVYTTDKEKKAFLSVFNQSNVLKDVINESASELISIGDTDSDASKLHNKTWNTLVTEQPENCYLLGIENQYEETWILGIVKLNDTLRVYVDAQDADYSLQIVLNKEKTNWLRDIVTDADKVY